ncbi:Long-chain-fatty-acid--CoA ligase [Mycolicibacterium rhodesiae JS60]|nr:Long-chain-fatty-acid--CoA ligase [Mycolicibacterium rhodesiae JS60]
MSSLHDSLTLNQLFEHAIRFAPEVPIVTRVADGSLRRYNYEQFGSRTAQLINALPGLGIKPGEVVATLAANSDRHLEAYFAVPCAGRVLHTLNPRFSPDDLAYAIEVAQDRAIFVDPEMIGLLEPIADRLTGVRAIVVLSDTVPDTVLPDAISYEQLLSQYPDIYSPSEFDERSPLGICFTTGTTGRPKGVTYTHRSTVLHALTIATGAGMSLGPSDCTCAMVPMFHANCFGLPHAAAAVGAAQVFYAGTFDPSAFVDLLISEQATFSAAVPTIWHAVAADIEKRGLRLDDLRHIITAGARPPASLAAKFRDELGINMIQAYGMTEASPTVAVAWPKHYMRDWDRARVDEHALTQSGLPLPLVSLDLRDDDGAPIAWDGATMGSVHVRGPWIADEYLNGVSPEQFNNSWFSTGDIAIGSPSGYFKMADRSKDLVKSGGEWISSVDMENAICSMAAVSQAAVIAVPDDRWDERPLPIVVPAGEITVDIEAVRTHLEDAGFPRWQLPQRIEIADALPLTSIGKIDKKALRARYAVAVDTNSQVHK